MMTGELMIYNGTYSFDVTSLHIYKYTVQTSQQQKLTRLCI